MDTPKEILAKRCVIVPDGDETLEPWGSVIHWQEIYRKKPDSTYKFARWFVPVTCGNPSNNEKCQGKREVWVMRATKPGLLTAQCLATFGEQYTGLCKYCFLKKIRIKPEMPDGSSFVLREDYSRSGLDGESLVIICGKCETKQSLKATVPIADNFTFHCHQCKHSLGTVKHNRGATVFWLVHWLRRILERTTKTKKVPFACAKCGELDFTFAHQPRNKRWAGLCKKCYQKVGHPRMEDHDVTLWTGSIILYSKRKDSKDKHVDVVCGFPGCGDTWTAHVYSTTGKRREEFTGFCPHKHSLPEIAKVLQSLAQNGNGQQNGNEELLEDVKAFTEVWKKEKSPNASADEQIGRVTQAKVSRYIGGPTASEGLFGSRLRRHKVNLMFPKTKSWYNSFAELVIKEFEKGTPENQIVSILIQRLNAKKP